MSKLEELKKKLREIFQLDQTDLDFGIYKIMNEKSAEVTDFLDNKLIPQVKECFDKLANSDKSNVQKELEEAMAQAKSLGANPDDLPRVKELKAQLTDSVDLTLLENDVYSHLVSFFSRYYQGGDFMSLRRYKKDVYAIPYEGEEVKLHWANSDQYYIKTSENFKDYSFFIGEGEDKKSVHFKLVEAETEKDNNKADKERRFMLVEEKPVYVEDGELYIKFEYKVDENKTKQQDAINKAIIEKLLPELNKSDYSEFNALLTIIATEKNKTRTVLEKHLTDYTAKNNFDYFIHKDLGGFLNRELDFYIKNEVLNLDDLDEKNIQKNLGKAKAIKMIAKKLITFLAQLEEFQKKLWLKKKFVVETNYCITLDKVDERFYPEIADNKDQIDEWEKLFVISDIKEDLPNLGSKVLTGNDESKKVEFLKQNPYLQVDTKFFSTEFKYKLLSTIENLDEQTNGVLINADNFHALNLLQEKYKEKVKCIYIDPPYNTGEKKDFPYKDSYKDSSWLSALLNINVLGQHLLIDNGIFYSSIGDKDEMNRESAYYSMLLDDVFGKANWIDQLIIVKSTNGQGGREGFATNHEYIMTYKKHFVGKGFRSLLPSEEYLQSFNKQDIYGKYKTDGLLRKKGAGSRREDSPGCYYPLYFNSETGDVSLKQKDGYKEVYPKLSDGSDGRWTWSPEYAKDKEFRLFAGKEGTIYIKEYLTDDRREKPKSVLLNKSGYLTDTATNEIKNIFGYKIFPTPKPLQLIVDIIDNATNEDSLILDYYSGSGVTSNAVMELNRLDKGKRKYILCEMGEYFEPVTKARTQKIIYSREWKDGKPVNRDGVSQIFKYMSLESYEDACNNLKNKEQQMSLTGDLEEQYKLNYMFDFEYSDSLLNIEMFENPFDYKMNITQGNETKLVNIDLVETFNYLIGLNVSSIHKSDGFLRVEGQDRNGDEILVIWRNTKEKTNADLDALLKKRRIDVKDFNYKKIYVNGDNNLQNMQTTDDEFKVCLIEEEFRNRMFDIREDM